MPTAKQGEMTSQNGTFLKSWILLKADFQMLPELYYDWLWVEKRVQGEPRRKDEGQRGESEKTHEVGKRELCK